MAIDVVAENYHGKVVIRDQKSDGSAVLLVCEEWDPTGPTTGPAGLPEPHDGSDIDQGFFPIGGTQAVGVMELDVSMLPSGLSFFDSHRFCESAVATLREGIRVLSIGREEAEAFGYRGTRGRGMAAGA